MNNLKLSSQKVRIGKHIIIELSCDSEKEASNIIEESCKKLLANQITEECSYTIEEITS